MKDGSPLYCSGKNNNGSRERRIRDNKVKEIAKNGMEWNVYIYSTYKPETFVVISSSTKDRV